MRFAMAGPALRHIRMRAAVTEGTGKCLMLGYRLLQKLADLFMTGDAECSRSGQGIVDLQRMVGRMAAQAVRAHLALGMRFMALGTIRYLAVYLMAEGTELLRMGTLIIGKVLTGPFMAGKTGIFYIRGKIQGKWLMRIGMAAEAVVQFKMGLAFMAPGALRYDIFTPGRMLFMTIKTGNLCLVLAAVTGNCCRFICVTLDAVCHLEGNQFSFCLMGISCHHCNCNDYST